MAGAVPTNAGAAWSARTSVSRRGKTSPPRPVLTMASAARAITAPVNNQLDNEATVTARDETAPPPIGPAADSF